MELLLELSANFRRTIFIPHWVPTPTNLRLERAIRQIEKVLYRMIAEKRASGRDAGDLLSMLLAAQDEDGSRMTDQQLRDEAITLFLAGPRNYGEYALVDLVAARAESRGGS